MTAVTVPPELLEEMRHHARASYPEECCGFLFSLIDRAQETPRPIRSIALAPNEQIGARHRRFVISADRLRAAERAAAERGEVVSGFFHSHPDHPARPSGFDQEHAWPWYSYLILSVGPGGTTPEVGAFEIDPEAGEFVAVSLVSAGTPVAAVGEER